MVSPISPLEDQILSDLGHTNGLYGSVGDVANGGMLNGGFSLDAAGQPYHDMRAGSPYGLPQSPSSITSLSGHTPLLNNLGFSMDSLVGPGGPGNPGGPGGVGRGQGARGSGPNSDDSSVSISDHPGVPTCLFYCLD